MNSNFLNQRALKGMARIGDLLIPGDGEYPSFTDYCCLEHIDDLVSYAPRDDIKDLNMVLALLSYMPAGVLRWLVRSMANAHQNDGKLGTLFRQLNLGIRGIVFSLYYSEKPGKEYTAEHPVVKIGFTLNKVMN